MKRILFLMLFGFNACGATSTYFLNWNASPTPGVTNYCLYSSQLPINPANLAASPEAVKTSTGTVLGSSVVITSDTKWFFVVTAMANGVESTGSNLLQIDPPQTPVVTLPPSELRSTLIRQQP